MKRFLTNYFACVVSSKFCVAIISFIYYNEKVSHKFFRICHFKQVLHDNNFCHISQYLHSSILSKHPIGLGQAQLSPDLDGPWP